MKNEKKKIVYISSAYFPHGQAYSTRILNFARILTSINYDVHIIADKTLDANICKDRIFKIEDATYEIIGDTSLKYRLFDSTNCTLKALDKCQKAGHISFVIFSAGDRNKYKEIYRYCKKNGIKIILEICEWYDVTSFKLRKYDPRFLNMKQYMNNYFYLADYIIAISTLLEKHFSHKHKSVIRIPTILDVVNSEYTTKTNNSKIHLVHAGTAVVHKEKFKNILLALSLYGEQCPFEYYIYGSDRETVLRNIEGDEKLLDSLGNKIKIKGRIPQEEVHNVYMKMDYSIFIRPDKLSSHAGFPTKLAESMSAGTPVITNSTGDIGLYLKDGVNGFLLKESSPEEIKKVLDKILLVTEIKTADIRKNARKTAQDEFDYRSYISIMEQFIQ